MKHSKMGRRDFVKFLGFGTGALAIAPLPSPTEALASTKTSRPALKVGLLLPSSTIRPGMTSSLMNGMQVYFEEAKTAGNFGSVQLVPETIGLGSTVAARKATQLLKEADVDMVVGLVSTPTAMRLGSLFEAEQKVLMVVGAGEAMPHETETSPYVFHSTLNYWQSNWATGQWAAKNLGGRAFMVSSFYESGYDALYAFRAGFEQAGGTIIGSAVTHMSPDDDGMATAMASIQSAQPNVVFAAFNGKPAQEFMRHYASISPLENTALIGTPFMMSEQEVAPVDFYYGTAWLAGLKNAKNEAFSAQYRRTVGHAPDAFALLGYDTAQLLTHSQGLANAHFDGPRGKIEMKHQSTTGPIYLVSVKAGHMPEKGAVVSEFSAFAGKTLHTDKADDVRTGWMNPYLA